MRTRLVWPLGLSVALWTFVGCGDDDTSSSSGGSGGIGTGGTLSGGTAGASGGAKNGAAGSPGRGGAGGGNTGGATNGATGGAGLGGAKTTGGTTASAGASDGGVDGTDGGTAGMDGGTGGATPGEGGATSGGPTDACAPAVARGADYFDFPERFNRYYTDCDWQPSSTVYVSPDGTGNGSSAASPASVSSALSDAVPGRKIQFLSGSYDGCFELDSDHSGTYDEPIVLAAEPGVTINCCDSGRRTCFNLEGADYVAIDGFELVGGNYGVRAVGLGYPADEHQRGIAILNNVGHGQNNDPFFTGQSDWLAIQSCTAYDTGSGDGHGIYLSNGSDWNIARWNETYDTYSSDFQINADPASTCADEGIDFDDPECDAVAGSHPTGGRGASDFMLIEGNFFHHSLAQGPNFTSVRNSVVTNNLFALPARHGVSFWQETDNPNLGSSNNLVAHNLFVTGIDNRQAVQFINESTDNRFVNNVVAAVSAGGQLLATDGTTVDSNTFENNAWLSGSFGSEDDAPAYEPGSNELRLTDFDADWFQAFPAAVEHDPAGFAPSATAPWLDRADLLPEVVTDRDGTARQAPVDLGPFER